MKRTLLATLLLTCLFLPCYPGLSPRTSITRAQSASVPNQLRKASADLKEKISRGHGKDLVRVIIQSTSENSGIVEASVRDSGGKDVRQFQNFPLKVATMSADAALTLASRDEISHISLDREVRILGHVSQTTGADAVRTSHGPPSNRLDGTGIGIAVLDSGVDTQHRSFLDRTNNQRVVMSQDFTGEDRTDDPYGHGTHVASIAAGNGRISNARYIGIAPNASILNLRVLNSLGLGTTSGVLSALDWVLTNRDSYNIRVVNMSLGMAAIDSYRNDPVCLAVRGLVNAGIVVCCGGRQQRHGWRWQQSLRAHSLSRQRACCDYCWCVEYIRNQLARRRWSYIL